MVMASLTFLLIAAGITVATSTRSYIDLTYAFNNETVLFPGRTSSFNVEIEGFSAAGFWVASKGFCTSEHTSTHIDAPYHFSRYGITLDKIPLEDLIDIPGVMIDIYDKVHIFKNGNLSVIQNYVLTREDILAWEKVHGPIPPRSVVMLRTGWGSRWPDYAAYTGTPATERPPTEGSAQQSTLDIDVEINYPGFSAAAASLLAIERNVRGVGIDTLSIDAGSAKLFPAHQVLAGRGIYMIENVANLHLVPPTGFQLWMLPFKIDRGTGAPIRVVASIDNKL